jgi:alanine racemase
MSTRVEISSKAIKANITNFRKLLNQNTLFAAVIKSNAYGHGLLQMARLSISGGADLLAVNSIDEAITIRKDFSNTIILIMGEIIDLESKKHLLADENFWVVISRLDEARFLSKLSPRPKIHIKADTGMSRLGYSGDRFKQELIEFKNNNIPLEGILTHFASTEDFTEHSYSMKQLDIFKSYIQFAEDLGYKNLIKHASSSASTMLFEEARLDLVRIGISLYGLWASMQTRLSLSLMGKDFALTPALCWKTNIVHIQERSAGTLVGYGSMYKTNYDTRIAVLPVGYYEGFNRRLSNQGYVLINGERANILGRICMNMTMVDITHISDVKIGDDVILIGKSETEEVTADMLANLTGTINYDIVTGIQESIPRIIVD